MSIFTKRRKIVRKKQEEDRKRWDENYKKSLENTQLILDTTKYISNNHPEFESLSGDERVQLFATIYKKIEQEHKNENIL